MLPRMLRKSFKSVPLLLATIPNETVPMNVGPPTSKAHAHAAEESARRIDVDEVGADA